MTRRIFFQIHWFLGITAGIVLAVMGVTGAMLSFEDEIMAAISPGIVTLTPGTGAPLAPDAIIVRASAQRDGLRVASLTVEDDPALAWRVQFDPVKGKGRRGERSYVDPRDGRLLGAANGTGFSARSRTCIVGSHCRAGAMALAVRSPPFPPLR